MAHSLSSAGADASEDGSGRGTPIVAIPIQDGRNRSDTKKQEGLGVSQDGKPQYTLDTTGGGAVATWDPRNVTSGAIRTRVEAGQPANTLHEKGLSIIGVGVRRLTPLECERLQGFPDGWTEGQSDAARYRQLGNAVAVPVFEWVGRRIVTEELAQTSPVAA